jgi:hypothetical protein
MNTSHDFLPHRALICAPFLTLCQITPNERIS